MKNFRRGQGGFVLAVSMIFLVVMTLLAISAIRKATIDEKVAGNIRAQEIAFQAAERALRFCERAIDLAAGSTTICQLRTNAINVYENPAGVEYNDNDVRQNFPTRWNQMQNWVGNAKIATTLAGANMVSGVAEQPQCLIERWPIQGRDYKSWPYVITARGVGTVSTSVVWLQEVIRCGNY